MVLPCAMISVDITVPSVGYSLPNDEATGVACLIYLNLKSVKFNLRRLPSAYFASPDGLLPVSNISGNLVSGFLSMVFTLKTFKDDSAVQEDPKALEVKNTHHVFFFWVADLLRNLTLYLTWVEPNGERLTKEHFVSIFPWPLGNFYFNRQKKMTMKFLNSTGWASDDLGDILKRFDGACKHISSLLADGPFIFNRKKAGKTDCILAAYFSVFTTNSRYFAVLAPIISKYPSLTKLAVSLESLN